MEATSATSVTSLVISPASVPMRVVTIEDMVEVAEEAEVAAVVIEADVVEDRVAAAEVPVHATTVVVKVI